VQDDNGTILDSSATFEGKLVGSDITVRGRFKGDLIASGLLRIVEGSNIEANIKATRVEIGGNFQGEVLTESLELLEPGRASGTFRAKKLSVKEGAKLNGDLEVGDSVQSESPPTRARSSSTS
jgi:cytoskeletal protein CcmA (bactofilin family)